MADKILVAVKPKYPTRKATDKVLTKNESNFIDVVEVDVARQVIALLDTSYVAIIKDDQYYPVDVDNVFEQYEHLAAGEDLTVEADEKFGVKKLKVLRKFRIKFRSIMLFFLVSLLRLRTILSLVLKLLIKMVSGLLLSLIKLEQKPRDILRSSCLVKRKSFRMA